MQTRCPLCGEQNQCCVPSQGGDITKCWCAQVSIDLVQLEKTLALLPEAERAACICQVCANRFLKND